MTAKNTNMDASVVRDFGSEWSRFDKSSLSDADRDKAMTATRLLSTCAV